MARSQVTAAGHSLQIWTLAVNIYEEQMDKKGVVPSFGIVLGTKSFSPLDFRMLQNLTQGVGLGRNFWSDIKKREVDIRFGNWTVRSRGRLIENSNSRNMKA